jgi:hypothetical protein
VQPPQSPVQSGEESAGGQEQETYSCLKVQTLAVGAANVVAEVKHSDEWNNEPLDDKKNLFGQRSCVSVEPVRVRVKGFRLRFG